LTLSLSLSLFLSLSLSVRRKHGGAVPQNRDRLKFCRSPLYSDVV
jgi:hypothetical protein